MTTGDDQIRQGYINGIACYFIWGLLPIYFKLMEGIGSTEIVAQRICWSVLLLFIIALFRRELYATLSLMANRQVMIALSASAVLIGVNWLVYVWATANGHILAASLGYFLNPLVNVVLGVIVLKERLRRTQILAIGFAVVGVTMLAFAALETLWISVFLAISFGLYGLIRKIAPVEALPGLTIETIILMPFAASYLGWLAIGGHLGFGQAPLPTFLLTLSGVMTSVPLLLFARAARRLPLATMGLLQYLAPSLQFIVGFLLYNEPLGMAKLLSFVTIWVGLAIFTHDALGQFRQREAARRAMQAL